jgi:hypothetical protein
MYMGVADVNLLGFILCFVRIILSFIFPCFSFWVIVVLEGLHLHSKQDVGLRFLCWLSKYVQYLCG